MVREYEVSIANTFDAENMDDAVEQFREWLANSGGISGFRVEDIDEGQEYLYDTPDRIEPLGSVRMYTE